MRPVYYRNFRFSPDGNYVYYREARDAKQDTFDFYRAPLWEAFRKSSRAMSTFQHRFLARRQTVSPTYASTIPKSASFNYLEAKPDGTEEKVIASGRCPKLDRPLAFLVARRHSISR